MGTFSGSKNISVIAKNQKILKSSKSEDEKLAAASLISIAAEQIKSELKEYSKFKKDFAEDWKLPSKIYNYANSISDLQENGVVQASTVERSYKKLRKMCKTLISFASALDSAVEEEQEKEDKKEQQSIVKATKLSDSLDELASVDSDAKELRKSILQEIDKNKALITSLGNFGKKVPKEIPENRNFVMARLPLVVISNELDTAYKNAGFDTTKLGRYTVLKDQLLLGITQDTLKSSEIKEKLDIILKAMKARTGRKYKVVGKPNFYRTGKVAFLWLVEEKTMNNFYKQNNKYFSPKSWGFAFV